MSQLPNKKRLDEILISMELVTENIIKKVLEEQKDQRVKLGSLLLYHGYIDEAGLVKALTKQYGCEGVLLLNLKIHTITTSMIPKKLALARKVMPFDYNPDENALMVACLDPTDKRLIKELTFVARGKKVKLYVAAEIALNTIIAKHYLKNEISSDGKLLLEIPPIPEEPRRIKVYDKAATPELVKDERPAILLVTDDSKTGRMIQSLFENDDYYVAVTDSADVALSIIGDRKFDNVLIKDSLSGDFIDLVERVRKISPRTVIRRFDSASSLFLGEEIAGTEGELLMLNLDMFTSILTNKAKLSVNHSGRVGQYADKLCRRMGIPNIDRLKISNAAYVHDLARFYYSTDEAKSSREAVSLTIKLLTSLNYSPDVIEMLRSMYLNLRGKYAKRLPLEVLGGNILTIADLFCESIPQDERLSLDWFDTISKKLKDLIGKLFLPEVVDVFVEMIQDEMLETQPTKVAGQVMIYSEEESVPKPLEVQLKNEGFRTISLGSKSAFIEMYKRSTPDFMILVELGTPDSVMHLITQLSDSGVNFKDTPAFLLADPVCISRLTDLIDRGIEDIIAFDSNLDLLLSKIRRLQARLQAISESKGDITAPSGAFGRLVDMNLIDLIQALGPSYKTACLSIRKNEPDAKQLVIYFDHGKISFAEYKQLTGAEAVYEGIKWKDGLWTIKPITIEDLPESNNEIPNESILLEGCRLLEDSIQSDQPA